MMPQLIHFPNTAVTQAAEKVIEELKKRAAVMWEISADEVEWKDGKVYPAGSNAGSFEPAQRLFKQLQWCDSRTSSNAMASSRQVMCSSPSPRCSRWVIITVNAIVGRKWQ